MNDDQGSDLAIKRYYRKTPSGEGGGNSHTVGHTFFLRTHNKLE